MDLGYSFGFDLTTALTVVVSTTVLYFVFVGVLALSGQRLLAVPTSLELALFTVLGAVVGRSLLGPEPSLGAGLVAIATLFSLEAVSGRLRTLRSRHAEERRSHAEGRADKDRAKAVALVVAGRPVNEELRRRRVTEVALWSVLRQAGIRSYAEVALVVLEVNGRFSVLRTGEPIHPSALAGVRDANGIRARLEGHSTT
ncbi:DUF421 domain-containing protein [Nocardioidaceae bacterium]|nr:DUF421 domain-containing protein [Nocardioidaceae bacterium]